MAFTYGFYDSINGDRRYNAEQVSSLFDGLITDGVFNSIGNMLSTVPNGGLKVLVRSGKAWFNHTWSINDADYLIELEPADVLLNRIDAIVLEIDTRDEVRANRIAVMKGTSSTTPTKPTLINSAKIHQYPLSYITVVAGAEEITASNIEIVVGMTATPFVTGLVEHVSISDLFAQWNGEFDTWFEGVKGALSDDVAGQLVMRMNEVEEHLTIVENQVETIEGDINNIKTSLITTQTDVFTSDGVYTVPAKTVSLLVTVIGGGGGGAQGSGYDSSSRGYAGGGGGGGAGGYTNVQTITTINPNTAINVTVGKGGTQHNNGGASSFGSYVSASGGGRGNWCNEVAPKVNNTNYPGSVGGSGGSGGSGGGGGGRTSSSESNGYGGSGSSNGGQGGSGGYGYGGSGVNTLGTNQLYTGSGSGGASGYSVSSNGGNAGAGGGGGGGYGGAGGSGGNVLTARNYFRSGGGGGGGGGGYGSQSVGGAGGNGAGDEPTSTGEDGDNGTGYGSGGGGGGGGAEPLTEEYDTNGGKGGNGANGIVVVIATINLLN